MPHHEESWEEHRHEAIVHTHPHYHVTHNYTEATGGFEHLSSSHEHEHDHADTSHRHYPHSNFEVEHPGEAHVHDHDVPVKKTVRLEAGRKAAARTAEETPVPARRRSTKT